MLYTCECGDLLADSICENNDLKGVTEEEWESLRHSEMITDRELDFIIHKDCYVPRNHTIVGESDHLYVVQDANFTEE